MRHRIEKLQLNRFTSWRKATLKSMARNVVIYQSIKTTKVKAKAVKPLIERLIQLAKLNSLNAKRQAFKILGCHKLVKALFDDIGPRFANRKSGFVRIINYTRRRGDNAELVILELTEIKKREQKKHKKVQDQKPQQGARGEAVGPVEEKPQEKKEAKRDDLKVKEKPSAPKKPSKKFLGGIKSIFKKERDAL